MDGELQALEHENLSDTVYHSLCDAIIQGKFQPDDRLKIREIAMQLGTSVTPVRDAILRLAHDGAVVFRSPRDIRIPVLTESRYLEIRAIRLRLEGLAAESAAKLATKADVKTLEAILAANEEAIRARDALRGTALNQEFHFCLSSIARMPLLYGTLRRIWLLMGPAVADAYLDSGRKMIDFHYPVLQAIEHGDAHAAAAAIHRDIERGGEVIWQRVKLVT